jgi:hypothetical protein
VDKKKTVTMAFLGDTQLGYDDTDFTKGLYRKHDKISNLETMKSIEKSCGTASHNCEGLVIMGDLTNTGKVSQFNDFAMIYGPTSGKVDRWKGKIWPMLGNHDYADYVGTQHIDTETCIPDQFSPKEIYNNAICNHFKQFKSNGAAEYMTALMRSIVGGCHHGGVLRRFWSDFGGADHYDFNSMAYAWSVGAQRFIATHNYPTYEAKLSGAGRSLDFLADELRVSAANGQHAIVLIHDYGDHFCRDCDDPDCIAFHDIIQDSNVVAIMTGHIHERVGKFGVAGSLCINSKGPVENIWKQEVHLIGTGSPGRMYWARVQYNGGCMTVYDEAR